MEEVPKEIEDPDTHEVRTETELVDTGKFSVVNYKENSKDKFEQKCISLLDTYNRKAFLSRFYYFPNRQIKGKRGRY